MSKALLYQSVVGIHMAVNESHTLSAGVADAGPIEMTSDRYCRHCSEIALAYDPASDRARCRSCGELS